MQRARAIAASAVHLGALALVLVARPPAAGADEPAGASADECAAEEGDCFDFEFLSSGDATRMGLVATLTTLQTPGDDAVDGALLLSYTAETYRSRAWFSQHAQLEAALGGGSAGTNGALAAQLGFGVRLPFDAERGTVLRLGPSGSLLGNDRLELAMLEPLQLRAGYQHLSGATLLEAGVDAGLLASGRLRAFEQARSLSGALDLGVYFAARFAWLRASASAAYLAPALVPGRSELARLRIEACATYDAVATCARVDHLRAVTPSANALQAGLGVALTP